MKHLLPLVLLVLSGCDNNAPQNSGTRFYALDTDERAEHHELSAEGWTTFGSQLSTTTFELGTLPIQTLQHNCAEKVTDLEGVPGVVLVEPESGTGVLWDVDDKLVIKLPVRLESSARVIDKGGRAGQGVRVRRRAGVIHALDTDELKAALQWFESDPCADL